MEARIVDFPETRIAAVEHRGSPGTENATARRLIEWRIANRVSPERHRTFGIHYTDPRTTPAGEHRVDFAVEFAHDVAPNPQAIVAKCIPGGRCAVARHLGSRENNTIAVWLFERWLPLSGEVQRDFPIFFHYVNVGPHVRESEMITDVYLPIR
ncbi:MAG: AraC family transcriptional regulator [Steroidobacteraceae bacterium]